MSLPSKMENAEINGATARQSTRLAIAIPIAVTGNDKAGEPFKENTRTIVVNLHGARIATVHELSKGMEVTIENRVLSLAAGTSVVRIGEERTPQGFFEVGIRLLEADNIWGIQFPPED